MRLLLWFTLFIIVTVQFTQAGIYRRYVRRNRPQPMAHDRIGRREFQIYRPRPWPSFFLRRPRSSWSFQPPRMARNFRFHNERLDRVPHFHHPPTAHHYSVAPPMTTGLPSPATLRSWRPLDYGNPIDRDPTFDYAPPAVERVKFISEARHRRPTARSHTGMPPYSHRPPPPPPPPFNSRPSIWKMLTHKQRPKRPYQKQAQRQPQRYHGQSLNHPLYHHQVQHEAEIYPNIPNIVYFQPTDVMSSSRRPGPPGQGGFPGGPMPFRGAPGRPSNLLEPGKNLKPGSVSDASLYSGEVTSKSEFKPVVSGNVKPTNVGNKEYLFTVVGYKGHTTTTTPMPPAVVPVAVSSEWDSPVIVATTTTKKTPTVLQPVKTTPVTISTTHNSAVKPFVPTESLDHHKHNHNHHSEDIDESAEESEIVEEVLFNQNKGSESVKTKSVTKKEDPKLDLLDMVPPEPISPVIPNSFNILDSEKLDQDDDDSSQEQDPENEIPGTVLELPNETKRRPVFNAVKNTFSSSSSDSSYKTSTSVSVSVSKDEIQTQAPTSTTTPKPRTTTVRAITTSTTTAKSTTTQSSSTTQATTPKSTKFPRLPTMPTYKKKPTPIYARKNKNNSINGPLGKYSSSSTSSALSKDIGSSGEVVVITAGRSKVKEYKPQFIADNTQLLSFDSVADSSSTSSSIESSTPSPSTTTTKSPLQEFDPMQLLHSWFTKSQD